MKKVFFAFVILTLFAGFSAAQEWVQTNGPGGGQFLQIAFNAKKDIFILTGPYSSGTLIRSTDNGKTWSNIAPSVSSLTAWWNVAIAPNQEIYLTGSDNDTNNSSRSGIWRSTDNGNSWIRLGFQDASIVFIGPDNTIFVSSRDTDDYFQFLRSKNSAKDWDTLHLPLPLSMNSSFSGLIDSNGVIFLNVDSGSLVSRDQGNTWQRISYKISACGRKGNIFSPTSAGRFHSSDDGMTWNQLALPALGKFVANPAGQVFYYRSDSLLYSADDGITWNNIILPSVKTLSYIYSFKIFGDANSGLYYSQHSDGEMFHAAYPGAPWTPAVFPTGSEYDIAAFENGSLAVLAPTYGADSYIDPTLWSSDSLQSHWQFNGIFSGNFYKDSNDNVFLKEWDSLYTSQDAGKSWKSAWKNISGTIYSLAFFKDIILATLDNSLVISYDGGISWIIQNRSVGISFRSNDLVDLMASHDGLLYGTGYDSLYRSTDKGITFQKLATPFISDRISLMISNLYGEVFASGFNSRGIYRSKDQGETWSFFIQGLTCTTINSLIELPNGSIAAATDSGVFILPLGGCQWQSYSRGLWLKNVPCIACNSKGELYAGSDGCCVFKSTKLFNDAVKLTMIEPGAIDYQTVTTGLASCQDVVLRNKGAKSFTIASFTVVDPTPFSVSDASAKKLPVTINPNDSLTMTICFHPPQPAVYTSQVIWNTDIDPSLCGISRETKLHGIAIPQSSVQNSSPTAIAFSLHPNPVSGNLLTVSFPESQSQSVALSVYDVLGREIYRNNIVPGLKEFDIPIRDQSEGVYYVRLVSNGVTVTKQFLRVK